MSFKVELHKRTVKYPSGKKAVYWTLRWWGTDGKRYSESIGKVGEMTKNEADTARRAKEAAIGTGQVRRDRPREMTLSAFITHDEEVVKADLKPATLQENRIAGGHAVEALGGDTKLVNIGPAQVGRLKHYLLNDANVAPATLAKTLRTLKAMFNRAKREGLIEVNPFVGVKSARTQSRAKRIFSADETRAMREVVPNLWWRVFVALAESSGFRKNELLNLHWKDIDFERKTARVTAKRAGSFTVPGKGEFPVLAWSAKTYEERMVPLPDSVLSLLAKMLEGSDGSAYVFLPLERLGAIATELEANGGHLGTNYELVNNMNRYFDLVQRMARERLARERKLPLDKVAWERGTIHDLRRTYGTRLALVVPVHVLKEYMGHAKIQTTQEYYLAAEAEDAATARDALDRLLSGGTPQGRIQDACSSPDAPKQGSKNDGSPAEIGTSDERGGRDSNPQPPDRQSGTLTN